MATSKTPSLELSDDDRAFLESGGTVLEGEGGQGASREEQDTAAAGAGSSEVVAGAEEQPADAGGKKPSPEAPRMVDKKALDAEREARKREQKERAREREEYAAFKARTEERLAIMQQAWQQPAQQPQQTREPAPPPDMNADPIGYIKWLGDQHQAETQALTKRLAEIEGGAQRSQANQQRMQAQQQAMAQLEAAYRADAATFRDGTPDFQQAYDYLISSRQRELGRLPQYRNNPMALVNAVRADEMAIARAALEAGESPAEILYGLAQERGWKPGNGQAQPQQIGNGKGSGEEQIQRLRKAQDASTSLSRAGGAPGGNAITLEQLDRMSKDEFDAFVAAKNKGDPRGFDKWMGKQILGS